MIKAYHQVGNETFGYEHLGDLLNELVEAGVIEPASMRISRGEMHGECFGDADLSIAGRFPKVSRKVIAALEEIAKNRISGLPLGGSRQTLFNCVDLIAGDIDYVFLRPGDWYSFQNGFVFDAEELIREGARFRAADMLWYYSEMIKHVGSRTYKTVATAKKALVRSLEDLKEDMEHRGSDGLHMLHWYLKEEGGFPDLTEIVWPGPLPLDLAIEAWHGSHRIF